MNRRTFNKTILAVSLPVSATETYIQKRFFERMGINKVVVDESSLIKQMENQWRVIKNIKPSGIVHLFVGRDFYDSAIAKGLNTDHMHVIEPWPNSPDRIFGGVDFSTL